MADLDDQIRDLRQRTVKNRIEFIRADLKTCFIGLDRARLELSLGNTDEAKKEVAAAQKGAGVIDRFLREAPDPDNQLHKEFERLQAVLAEVRQEVNG
jgi:hypothetical protein